MSKEYDYSWIFAGVLAVAGVGLIRALGGPGGLGCRPAITRGASIVLTGDSLAVGMAPFFRAMADEYGVRFASLAKESTRTDQWAQSSELQGLLANSRPNLVLVSLGTNDSRTVWSATEHAAHAKQLLEMIVKAGANVVWILPPSLPFSDGDRGFSEVIRSLGVPVFESDKLDIPRGPDNLHPTTRGYSGWAGAVWSQLTCGAGAARALGQVPAKPRASRALFVRRNRAHALKRIPAALAFKQNHRVAVAK
jgi:lysophospholipase L1-like esterase